jgi:hypothetical protein
VLIPDAALDDEIPPPPTRASVSRRITTYLGVSLAAALLAILTFYFIAVRPDSSARHPNATLDIAAAGNALTLLDRRADTLALALDAFTIRAGMFDSRRMACSGLSRGLQQVEAGWIAYNLARKEALTAMDPARENRDKTLFANVRAIEVRFERSSCVRP